MEKKLRFNSKTIHGGQHHDPAYGAVMPPIYQTSTYAQTTPGGHKGFEYSRTHNPTRQALEKSLASIENGKHGLAFGSGLAAIDAVLKLLNDPELSRKIANNGRETVETSFDYRNYIDRYDRFYKEVVSK